MKLKNNLYFSSQEENLSKVLKKDIRRCILEGHHMEQVESHANR